MAEECDPVDIALTEVGEGDLFAEPIVGKLPVLNEYWRAKCGWLVHFDEEGKVQHLSFHTSENDKVPNPNEAVELRERVRQLSFDPKFDVGTTIEILRQIRARTAAFLVELIHDQTGEVAWVLYRHAILDPEQAKSLLCVSLRVVETDEAENETLDDEPGDATELTDEDE
jgi:hypothetical protein